MATIEDTWDINTRRPLNDREQEACINVKRTLPIPNPTKEENTLNGIINGNMDFTIASTKESIHKEIQTNIKSANSFLELIWKARLHKKCKFFMWSIKQRCINTIGQHTKKNVKFLSQS